MVLLNFWRGLAALVLVVSFCVHSSTFFGFNPMDIPGVMLLHLAIFPPFIAAIVYGSRATKNAPDKFDLIQNQAPRWMTFIAGALFVYAFVNFFLFFKLSEGGSPHERGGQYFLMNHGHVIREITQQEFHQQQTYVVRGFSGHWMLFSSAAIVMLTGTANLARAKPQAATEENV